MVKEKKMRHAVDVFRVRYWYRGVMRELKLNTAYKVERQIEPEHFHIRDRRTVYPVKWTRYKLGENTPQKKLVLTTDNLAKGSKYELDHSLWTILKKLTAKNFKATEYIQSLDPTIQALILQSPKNRLNESRTWISYTNSKAQVLLRRGTLDALAALVLYWHEAKSHKNHQQIESITLSIYHMLLLIGWDVRDRQLLSEFFSLFKAEIFDKTAWANGSFAVDKDTFEISICLLHNRYGANLNKDAMKASDWRKEMSRIQNLLTIDTGFDIWFAMKPLCLPQWNFGPPTRSEVMHWEIYRRHWAWGWDCLLHNKKVDYPDNDLYEYDLNTDCIVTRSEDIYLQIQDIKWSPIPKTSILMLYGQPFYSSDV
ncbi:hypothetical protein [uncultured Tolumonas sp.]|uniref:hypothetical protein n=1 Tax=uncultured Tolumonas sp. TaxID=263765 RepID=UPI00292F2AAC|nr:hypothetical protein [uncultured Tolumonas sp.]